ncbi:MAG: glycosyltransferase family 2 protein [Pseudomonadota bacterium]
MPRNHIERRTAITVEFLGCSDYYATLGSLAFMGRVAHRGHEFDTMKTDETKAALSVAIITKDEAHNLPDCLSSVRFADQVVVVDSGSADETVHIAEDFGCEIFRKDWQGFGAQKQFAIDQCRNKWVLVLDADERIPEETARAIRDIVAGARASSGYSFPRKNYFQGRWIRHAGWWPDRVVRLFQKGCGSVTRARVHEAIHINGPVVELKTPIEHYTESRLDKVLLKIDRYSTLGAEEAYQQGKKTSVWSAGSRAMVTFVQDYFFRLGFLDGPQGFTLAVTDSINKFFKYAKLNQLNLQTKQQLTKKQ